jgi:hypothetical protein
MIATLVTAIHCSYLFLDAVGSEVFACLSDLLFCRPLEAQLANMECNATSAVTLTHHFLDKLVCRNRRLLLA